MLGIISSVCGCVDLKIGFFVILGNSSVVGCFFAHYEDMWKRTSSMCKGGLSYR